MEIAHSHLLPLADHTPLHAPDSDPANVFIVIDRRYEKLSRPFRINLGSGHVFQNGVEKRRQILSGAILENGGRAVFRRAVNNGTVQLLVGGVEIQKKLQNLIDHLVKPGVRSVDFVDHNDHLVVKRQSMLKHKAGLRHRAFGRVHQQKNAVDHLQNTLHLAAEIGVARGVHNVDLDILVANRGILRQNGDAALALDVAGVHHALGDNLVVSVNAALLEHLIDQRRFAVVNVGNDGDVS